MIPVFSKLTNTAAGTAFPRLALVFAGAVALCTGVAHAGEKGHEGDRTGGRCCRYTGPVAFDCASIENLPAGADYDGRCNAVNQGQSCSWDYSVEKCCDIAVEDGHGNVTCGNSGECCLFTGPVPFDCEWIENLGPGADLDGRCNSVYQGNSCSWDYSEEKCCEIAVEDGYGDVTCGNSGECCTYTGPVPFDCEWIENLGPGADLDGRCNAVNQGNSCSWSYAADSCCKIAVDDGFPGSVTCK